jgi:hypothetical protein
MIRDVSAISCETAHKDFGVQRTRAWGRNFGKHRRFMESTTECPKPDFRDCECAMG